MRVRRSRSAGKANLWAVDTIAGYLERLASVAPTPGGGSAAALVGSTGAALAGMVARICAANPRYADREALALAVVASSRRLIEAFGDAATRDEAAFAAVIAAQALPKATPAEGARRRIALDAALVAAAAEPLDTMELCLDVLRDAQRLLDIPNQGLRSDVGCAAEFGFAALRACAYNVDINHRYARDAETVAQQQSVARDRLATGEALLSTVRAGIETA